MPTEQETRVNQIPSEIAALLNVHPLETPRLLLRSFRQSGLMTGLLRAVYAVLFEKARLDDIQSGYLDFNAASAALHRKPGTKLWTEDEFDIYGQLVRSGKMILFRAAHPAGKDPQKTR